MPTLKVGQSYPFSCAGSDGSTIPPGTLSVVCGNSALTAIVVNPDATGTITAKSAGSANITYSAPNFQPAQEAINIAPDPSIVVTDGPITG